MAKNILVLLGHSDSDTFSGAMASMYQSEAEAAGHTVARVNLGDLQFDPILHRGYKEIQELEPDLVDVQEKFKAADHIVVVYPNWWCTMPALLKGFFDRIWLPGFAFNFNKETKKVDRHLKGKTARVIIVAGTHSSFQTWWRFGDFSNEIQHGILGFAGIKTDVTVFGPCDKVGDICKQKWIKHVGKLASRGQ